MQKIPNVTSLPFNKQEVKTLDQLRSLVGYPFVNSIILQSHLGDPDWLYDIVSEIDDTYPGATFHIPEFHGILQEAGYRSVYFDCDALDAEIMKQYVDPAEIHVLHAKWHYEDLQAEIMA